MLVSRSSDAQYTRTEICCCAKTWESMLPCMVLTIKPYLKCGFGHLVSPVIWCCSIHQAWDLHCPIHRVRDLALYRIRDLMFSNMTCDLVLVNVLHLLSHVEQYTRPEILFLVWRTSNLGLGATPDLRSCIFSNSRSQFWWQYTSPEIWCWSI